jgi:AhpC/TSA family protein
MWPARKARSSSSSAIIAPYVKAVINRLVSDARQLMREGVGFGAICSNDAESYPEDSLANMREFARRHDFPFPYLHDETQEAAGAYDAVCTPDFFGYNRDLKLKYRGRLDEGRTTPPLPGARQELVEAMRAIATTGLAPANQVPHRLFHQVEAGVWGEGACGGRVAVRATGRQVPAPLVEAMREKEGPQLTRGPRPPSPTGGDCRSGRIEPHRDYLLGLIRRRPDQTFAPNTVPMSFSVPRENPPNTEPQHGRVFVRLLALRDSRPIGACQGCILIV